jgi:hypothetical protein
MYRRFSTNTLEFRSERDGVDLNEHVLYYRRPKQLEAHFGLVHVLRAVLPAVNIEQIERQIELLLDKSFEGTSVILRHNGVEVSNYADFLTNGNGLVSVETASNHG